LSVKAEYLFMDFNKTTASAPIAFMGGLATETTRIKENVVRAGVSHRA
jgi:opacity protein-like surface antigen